MWLYFIQDYASKQCAKHLTLYFYFTSLYKKLPENNIHILDEEHVNTGFTYTCPTVSEIVIFRREEWFKVLLHETFHNFGLDFSDMNTEDCKKKILDIFPVDSEVNLYESYTEFWAEVLNAAFCSFFMMGDENSVDEYIENCHILLHFERIYSLFQLVKVLHFMGLMYKSMYLSSAHVERTTMYKENSNILAYYIIKTILLNNYNGFLLWSDKNNMSLLQFKKTPHNLEEFCRFIEQNYKKKGMLDAVKCVENMYFFSHSGKQKQKQKNLNFIWTNMRMTICEME